MLRGDSEGDGGKATEGRAAVEEALRLLRKPPHSLQGAHPWVIEFGGLLASASASARGDANMDANGTAVLLPKI